VVGDDGAAAAGGVLLVHEVFGAHTLGGTGIAQLLGRGIVADAADVDGGVGWEDVLEDLLESTSPCT
jgi:hypothetical protein